jgi:hypothetical protein
VNQLRRVQINFLYYDQEMIKPIYLKVM